MATTVYGNLIRYGNTSSGWRSFLTYSDNIKPTSCTISCYGGFSSVALTIYINYAVDATLSCTGQQDITIYDYPSISVNSGQNVDLQMVSNENKIYTFERTKSPQTITLSCRLYSDSNILPGTSTASTTITIPALDSYTISYDANGGVDAPSSHTKYYGESVTLSSVKPTRTNYEFLGWSTSSDADTATYSPGQTYSDNAGLTLYAVWKQLYIPPSIYDVKVDRCDSNGNYDDLGTSVKIEFSWSCSQIIGSNEVSNITVGYKMSGSESYEMKSLTVSGTSGSIIHVGGINDISQDYKYDIIISVTDKLGEEKDPISKGTTTYETTIPTAKFVLDFKSGGKGVAIGKASAKDCFEVAMNAEFSGDAKFLNTVHINDVDLDTYIDDKIKNSSVDVKYDISYGTDFPPETGTIGSVYIQYVE